MPRVARDARRVGLVQIYACSRYSFQPPPPYYVMRRHTLQAIRQCACRALSPHYFPRVNHAFVLRHVAQLPLRSAPAEQVYG